MIKASGGSEERDLVSKTFSFDVSDELYEGIRQTAARLGRPVEEVGIEWLAKHLPGPRDWEPEPDSAGSDQLEKYAGAISTGDRHSADNDKIDADLAIDGT